MTTFHYRFEQHSPKLGPELSIHAPGVDCMSVVPPCLTDRADSCSHGFTTGCHDGLHAAIASSVVCIVIRTRTKLLGLKTNAALV